MLDKNQRRALFIETMQNRFACKKFDENRSLNEEDVQFILEAARLSPSSFGFEPWKFLRLENKAIKNELAKVAWGAQSQMPGASLFILALCRREIFMGPQSKYLYDFMLEVKQLPEDMAKTRQKVFSKFHTEDVPVLGKPLSVDEWSARQLYLPLANMLTAAAFIGVDSCPIEGFNRQKAEAILIDHGHLNPLEFTLTYMAAFGYRAEEPLRPKTRQTMGQIVETIF
ncbi:MAG: NAD(P)H-dependent oxidoreductase [Candidatus Adiutrix sp.]